MTFGPIFRKEFFHTINTVNLFLEHDVGPQYASGRPGFIYAWETRIALGTPIEPGFQAYGQPSGFEPFNSGWPQDNRIGPQVFGTISNIGPGSLRWNGGILFGIRPWAPRDDLALASRIRNPLLSRVLKLALKVGGARVRAQTAPLEIRRSVRA